MNKENVGKLDKIIKNKNNKKFKLMKCENKSKKMKEGKKIILLVSLTYLFITIIIFFVNHL